MDPRRTRAKFLLAASIAAALMATALPAAPRAAAAPLEQRVAPTNASFRAPQLNAPDLHLTLETTSCDLTTRDVVARVRNEGSPAAQSFTVNLDAGWQQRQDAVSSLGVGREVSFPAITVNYSIDLVARIGPGSTVSMAVDSDPSDDSATNTRVTSGCPLPDLRVTRNGSRVRVENIGTLASPATTLRHRENVLSAGLGGGLGYVTDEDTIPVPSIPAGGSWDAGDYDGCGLPYRKWSSFRVDPANQIVELNESNNYLLFCATL